MVFFITPYYNEFLQLYYTTGEDAYDKSIGEIKHDVHGKRQR